MEQHNKNNNRKIFTSILIWCFASLFAEGKHISCSTEKRCQCIKGRHFVFANCSGLNLIQSPNFTNDVTRIDLGHNRLEEVPSNLPSHVTHLNLTDNAYIKRIKRYTLQRLIYLRYIVLSYCDLKQIDTGALRNNRQLEHLDLSDNQELTLSVLRNISFDLQQSHIKTLLLDKIQCTYGITNVFRFEYIKYLTNTPLKKMSIASNRISYFEKKVLSNLPRLLEELNVADNQLTFGFYVFLLNRMKSLKSLNASFQGSFHRKSSVYNACNDTKSVNNDWSLNRQLINRVHRDNLLKRKKRGNVIIYLPPNVEKIYFHDNMYKMELYLRHFISTSEKLTHLYLQNNIFYRLIGPIKGLKSLQYVDISNNLCTDISTEFFDELSGIKHLNLSQNLLSTSLENDRDGKVFRMLFNIEVLDLSKNRLRSLPKQIFRNMNNLTILYLGDNSLGTFVVKISHMYNLSKVDLSNNQISTIGMSIRDYLSNLVKTRNHIRLNLLENPIHCTCKNMDFLKWMLTVKVIFPQISKYECVFVNTTTISLQGLSDIVKVMQFRCETYLTLIVILTLVLFSVITIVGTAIINRYRWRLRYLYYLAKRRYIGVQQSSDLYNKMYRYDAFVSYAEEDGDFIFSKLDFLETQNKLKLCLHSRDFVPGADIADNIANAIHHSKRTMCLLTPHFITSYWCMYELNMARMESIYSRGGDGIIFLIVLKRNIMKNIPLKIIDLFETQSYLEYPENELEDMPFWNKMCETLLSPTMHP